MTTIVAEIVETGPQGPQGERGPSFTNYKGAWSGATAYAVNDAVTSGGSSYICILAHTNQAPPNATYWGLIAAKGDTGATGATGPQGPAGSVSTIVATDITDSTATGRSVLIGDAVAGRTALGLGTAATSASTAFAAASHVHPDFSSSNAGFAPASGGGTSNFLRADGTWTAPPTGSAGRLNQQTFNVSGTWNKPSGFQPNSMVLIQAWGGGGGGARAGKAAGGGGGSYSLRWVLLSTMGVTETVTVGLGGTGRTGTDGVGTNGGTTTVGSLLSAFGGCGGSTDGDNGGGFNTGGGHGGIASQAPNTAGSIFAASNSSLYFGVGVGGLGSSTAIPGIGGVGGGGGGSNTTNGGAGGAAENGGGGGGGRGSSAGGAGGVSQLGGNGGAGGTGSASGSVGVQPSGGGGGSSTSGGNGGDGRVIITVFELL